MSENKTTAGNSAIKYSAEICSEECQKLMKKESRAIYTPELRILQTSKHWKKAYRKDLENTFGPIIYGH